MPGLIALGAAPAAAQPPAGAGGGAGVGGAPAKAAPAKAAPAPAAAKPAAAPAAPAKPAAPTAAKAAPAPAAAAPPPAAKPTPPPAPPAPPKPAPAPVVVAPPPAAVPPPVVAPPPVPVPPPAVPPVVEPSAPGLAPATVAPDQLSPEELAALESKDLDVVKVTVDRREKSIQDYAGSASAFTQDQLDRLNVTSLRRLSDTSPYLEIGTQEGNTEIFIRGIGGTDNTELGDPATATYFGDVYIPRPRGVGSMFFDLDRVEINRGPQGTLRGRNATAGSINLVPMLPRLNEFQAMGDIQYGNYSDRLTRAMVNVPIAPNLALRFATFSDNHLPFYKNAGPVSTITPTESADVLAYRASLLWLPLHNLKITIRQDFTQELGTGYGGTNYAPALQAGLLPQEVPDPRAVIFRGPQPSQDMKHWGLAGIFDLDLGPLQAQLISSYRDLDYRQTTPGNAGVAFPGMPDPQIDNWSTSYWHTASKSTVQELRVYAPDQARFRWTAGTFFFYEKQRTFLGSVADQSNGYAGVEYNMPHVQSDSEAGYLDGTFDIRKFLRATGGFRFTREHKERTGLGAVYLPNTNGMPFRFGTEGFQFADTSRTIYDPMNPMVFQNGIKSYGARDTLPQLLVDASSAFTAQNGTYTDHFFDWRLGMDWDLTPRNLVYVTATTGHHSGGFNDNINVPSSTPGAPPTSVAPTYNPERLYALEIGSKNQTPDRKLIANAAAFGYLYYDQQFQGVQALINPNDPSAVPAATLVRFNAAKSHVLGLEADGSYKLPFGLIAGLQAMFLYARFDDSNVTDSRLGYDVMSEPVVNLKGHTLPRAPTITVAYSLGQNFSTPIGYFDWVVSAQTRSKYYMTVFNGEGTDTNGNINPVLSDVQPAYTRLDAGIGYTRPNGKMRIEAVGNNLTNTTYMTSLINVPNLNLRFFNPPRTFGIHMALFY
jgi:iron complex outermembrane receptor protein